MKQKTPFAHSLKRAFDLITSSLGLLLLSPFFAIIAIGIKRDTKGPVFFRADRIGRQWKTLQDVEIPHDV